MSRAIEVIAVSVVNSGPNNQPCRSFSSTSLHLSLSIFSFPLHLSPVKRIGETDTPPGTSVFGGVTGSIGRRSLGVEEGLVRRTSSTKTAVYPGRTYRPHTSGGHLQRRKELASRYGRDDRTHSRGHRRTAALNHPSLERERKRESGFIWTTAKGASIRIWLFFAPSWLWGRRERENGGRKKRPCFLSPSYERALFTGIRLEDQEKNFLKMDDNTRGKCGRSMTTGMKSWSS